MEISIPRYLCAIYAFGRRTEQTNKNLNLHLSRIFQDRQPSQFFVVHPRLSNLVEIISEFNDLSTIFFAFELHSFRKSHELFLILFYLNLGRLKLSRDL